MGDRANERYAYTSAEREKIMGHFLTILLLIFATQGAFANTPANNTENAPVVQSIVNKEELKTKINEALQQYLPGAKILDIKEVQQNGETVCICSVSYQNTIVDLTINPKTGNITGKLKDENGDFIQNGPSLAPNKAAVRLTTVQVNNILKSTLPGASIEKVNYDKKTDTMDGYVVYQNLTFYFKINALTGEIITMQPVFK